MTLMDRGKVPQSYRYPHEGMEAVNPYSFFSQRDVTVTH